MAAYGARLGAFPDATGTTFRAWTTRARHVGVRFFSDAVHADRTLPLTAMADGLHEGHVAGVGPGALYKLVLDGRELPDPYARFLPFGVHGPAEVMARLTPDEPSPRVPRHRLSIYELHVGTFTPEGTYRAAAERLDDLVDLGVTAIELLPLSAFPGARGWGYDGVAHFAPFAPYGRPEDLRALVARAHGLGLLVLLDVVYNHFGPVGNYLPAYAPEYFTASVKTPWGDAPDFGHPRMRQYVADNARFWFEELGFDGLRLDATHAIHDPSPRHILRELRDLASSYDPPRLLFAEDDRNDPTLVTELGFDGIWADDFHHHVHVLLTGEQDGYYRAYPPDVRALGHAIERGWSYEGQVYPPTGRPRGRPADALEAEHFVYCLQNHDQVGNRPLGTRLNQETSLDAYCAAVMLLLFLPTTPLMFMGQEWAASTPFLYFTDHDPELGPKVSEGRREELGSFSAFAAPNARVAIPDPQAASTFERSKLRWEERSRPPHDRVLDLTKTMLRLRREDPVLSRPGSRRQMRVRVDGDLLVVERRAGGAERRTLVVNFGGEDRPLGSHHFGARVLASADATARWLPARSAAIYARTIRSRPETRRYR